MVKFIKMIQKLFKNVTFRFYLIFSLFCLLSQAVSKAHDRWLYLVATNGMKKIIRSPLVHIVVRLE